MTFFAFDTETHLIKPGEQVPRMVCLSYACEALDSIASNVLHRDDLLTPSVLHTALLDQTKVLVGQFVAYDMAVIIRQWPELLPLVFDAYNADRVTCTQVRAKLIDIAHGEYRMHGEYNLATLAKRAKYPEDLDKDTWRLRYSEFDQTPVKDWPEGAVHYSLHDALSTLWVTSEQEQFRESCLADQFRQARASFALHLVSAWGITTDQKMVAELKRKIQLELDRSRDLLEKEGLVYKDKKGVWHKRAKEAQARILRVFPEVSRTPTGNPSLDADSCELSGDSVLKAYAHWGGAVTALGHATELEPGLIHTRFDSLVSSGRTSASKPNIQNRSKEPGDRECFVPRPGMVFLDIDFDGLELRTAAQAMIYAGIRTRTLADALNNGVDPHSIVGSSLLKIPLEEFLERKQNPADKEVFLARQAGKIANFGLAGGLGKHALVKQARALYHVILTVEEAENLIAAWYRAWPEFREYFAWVNQQCRGGFAWVTQFVSERKRGHIPYTEACNTFFQGLGADVAKSALWDVIQACYVPGNNAELFGCRVVNFIHDEFILEVPEDNKLTERAKELERVVIQGGNKFLPDVPVTAKAIATRRWSKLAERIVVNGKLQVWEWDGAK